MSVHSADTRAVLLEAALFCFSEHGFEGTSLRMIAQRAGRPLSLIGHHFGGKDGLYLEVFKALLNPVVSQRLQAAGTAVTVPRNRQEAERLFREQVHILYVDVCPAREDLGLAKEAGRRLWLLEMSAPRPEILELLKERLSPWVERVRACIRVLRPDLDEAEITFLGTTILGQISGHGLLCGISDALWGCNALSSFKSAELLIEFTLMGLGVDPRQA